MTNHIYLIFLTKYYVPRCPSKCQRTDNILLVKSHSSAFVGSDPQPFVRECNHKAWSPLVFSRYDITGPSKVAQEKDCVKIMIILITASYT